jgi:histidinol-phosphatase (PHP family)
MSNSPHDYHLHTSFSVDCQVPMTALCERAIELGIPEICITEHADFVPEDEGYRYFAPAAYFAEIERCRALYSDRLALRAGVELGEAHRFPDEVAALLDAYPFDFAIGSLHWVSGRIVLDADYFAAQSADGAYGAYFAELLLLARQGRFDVIGHFDVPKRAGFDLHGPFDARQFAEPVRAVLRTCVERGIGMEINTGTMRRPVGEPSPELDVLRWYRELGGELLTLGSDAHRLEHVAYRFADALELARAAGFSHVACFEGHVPRFRAI